MEPSVTRANRIRSSIRAIFIADAASLGIHWIYDPAKIQALSEPKLFRTPAPKHWHFGKQSGDFTHYGDAALVLLRSIQDNGGLFEAKKFGQNFVDYFSDESYGGYLDRVTKGTLAAAKRAREDPAIDEYDFVSTVPDQQMVGTAALAVLVPSLLQADPATFDRVLSTYTLVRQADPLTTAVVLGYGAIVKAALEGKPVDEVITAGRSVLVAHHQTDLVKSVDQALKSFDSSPMSCMDTVTRFGPTCALKSGVPIVFHALKLTAGCDDLLEVLNGLILPGGDNASRAIMLCGLWGAMRPGTARETELWSRVTEHAAIDEAITFLLTKWT